MVRAVLTLRVWWVCGCVVSLPALWWVLPAHAFVCVRVDVSRADRCLLGGWGRGALVGRREVLLSFKVDFVSMHVRPQTAAAVFAGMLLANRQCLCGIAWSVLVALSICWLECLPCRQALVLCCLVSGCLHVMLAVLLCVVFFPQRAAARCLAVRCA
jgi:hypothetical protein